MGRKKGLLREAMRGVLPDEVLWRRKSPYPKTWNPSYLAAVSAELRAVLADPPRRFCTLSVRMRWKRCWPPARITRFRGMASL